MTPCQELGVTPPLGFWDPLGFSKYDDPEAGLGLGARGQQKYSFCMFKGRFMLVNSTVHKGEYTWFNAYSWIYL